MRCPSALEDRVGSGGGERSSIGSGLGESRTGVRRHASGKSVQVVHGPIAWASARVGAEDLAGGVDFCDWLRERLWDWWAVLERAGDHDG